LVVDFSPSGNIPKLDFPQKLNQDGQNQKTN